MRNRHPHLQHLFRMLPAWGMLLILGACAQARTGLSGNNGPVEVWSAQPLCANTDNNPTLACVDISPNITDNLAYVDVVQVNFDPAATPYRIYARRFNETTFNLLADNVTVGNGGSFEVYPANGQYIEEYEEWILELSATIDNAGFTLPAQPLQGIIAARSIIYWPELDQY